MILAVLIPVAVLLAVGLAILFRRSAARGDALEVEPMAHVPVNEEPGDPTPFDGFGSAEKIEALMKAIAKAEGFGVPEAAPTRLHNPGDISDGAATFGFEIHSGSKVTKFPDDDTGWGWLRRKIERIRDGQSKVYALDFTFQTFAQTWAGNWQPWLRIVTSELGIREDATLREYFGG